MKICNHCRHHKVKYLNGYVVSRKCKAIGGCVAFNTFSQCQYFSRSLKSRLGLVKDG